MYESTWSVISATEDMVMIFFNRDRELALVDRRITSLIIGIRLGFMLNSVIPSAINTSVYLGSPAISPQTVTGIPAFDAE